MSELERLKAEMERQDLELEACFEALRRLAPDMEIAVSPEWMSDLSATAASCESPTEHCWALRA